MVRVFARQDMLESVEYPRYRPGTRECSAARRAFPASHRHASQSAADDRPSIALQASANLDNRTISQSDNPSSRLGSCKIFLLVADNRQHNKKSIADSITDCGNMIVVHLA